MNAFNRSVVAVAYDSLCMFEFAVAAELFGLARPEFGVDWYEFNVVSTQAGPLTTLGGVNITTTADFRCLDSAGMIIIPGWTDVAEEPPQELIDALVAAYQRGTRLVSICSGVFVLAATGLLDGKEATTHWRYIDELFDRYPAINVRHDVLYVDNGSLMSSAGSAAGIDLGLHIIRQDYGPDIANEVARRMVVPAHREAGHAQLIPQPVAFEQDLSVSRTIEWALGNLHAELSVRSLSEHARMSERTFARRFSEATGLAPHRWLTINRVRRARDLLESTSLSIEQIAFRSGLGSAPNLRHHFQRELYTTPTQYRKDSL